MDGCWIGTPFGYYQFTQNVIASVDLGFGVLEVSFERECPVECDSQVHRVRVVGEFVAIP